MDSKDITCELGPLPTSDEQARLQRESFKALHRFLSKNDSMIFRDERVEDFGVDCSLEVKVGRVVTNFRTQVQMKSAAEVSLTQDGYAPLSVATANLNLLLNGTCPAYLLCDESTDEFWYTWAWDQAKRLAVENPSWKSQQTITLQFRTKLTRETLDEFQKTILAEGVFHRGLHDLIALGEQTSSSAQGVPLQKAVQLLSRFGASASYLLPVTIPSNDAEFERLCLDLLKQHWSRPGLAVFARPGEKTYGIDFLDLSGSQSVYAAALKSTKDKSRVLGRSEIDRQPNRLELSGPSLVSSEY